MSGRYRVAIAHWAADFFKFRDDLKLRNIRWELWPVLLVFPLSAIMGNLRYFDLKMAIAGFGSWELMLFPMGLGWLILTFTSKRLVIPLMRLAAVLSAALLPFQIFMPSGLGRLAFFMAFQFSSGICAAAAFCLFCFELNNIERLFGMVIIQFYYGFFYILWLAFPVLQAAGETWVSAVAMAACLIAVFASPKRGFGDSDNRQEKGLAEKAAPDPKMAPGTFSGAAFAIGLHVVYYMIMCMINHIQWTENSLSSMAFGIGSLASIILIIIIQLLNNRNALYIWLLFLVLSLLALGVLMYESPATRLSGSFAYGLGDGLGYIIIYYLCAASIKKSKSLKMFRLCCLALFVEYFAVSGIFSLAFDRYLASPTAPPTALVMAAALLVLCPACFLLMPLMQKKLFDADWTDDIIQTDIPQYTHTAEEAEQIRTVINTNFSPREKEVFALLLENFTLRQIGLELHISLNTVKTHYKNIYRKLDINNRGDLLLKFGGKQG
jgi:DNA-binding NarL/FixJ family response regulator